MGNRLTKIYTRTGDDGSTGLADGRRTGKDAMQIEVIGELDELNCCVGLVLAYSLPDSVSRLLIQVQHKLFDLGAMVSGADCAPVKPADIEQLEQQIDRWNSELAPLREFILPGGGAAAAHCHLARSVCRRLERRLVGWSHTGALVEASVLAYVNRLSDALFVLCRVLTRENGKPETQWQKDF
ncbi:MAG: cob(I)yrinic acid a,c-diamide adenosyltransferase [Gammaproteobacteria bacterium]|nr:cob(I)yrinic acid a,c-diamide adenosyltransferase [Gammaproteobacteria bacterium]